MHIQTTYGLETITNLSTGCKTYLNIIKNPDKVVSAEKCGKNVLDILFQLDGIHIYMNRLECFHIDESTKICFNDDTIITGHRGYEIWWSAEYERRAENDI